MTTCTTKTAIILIGATALLTVVAAVSLPRPGSQHGVAPADARWWRDARKLTSKDTADGDHFGRDVALDGDLALIGAPLHNAGAANAGAAYLFRLDRSDPIVWRNGQDATTSGEYGASVALRGRFAVVGKPGHDYAGEDTGAAYLYQRDGHGKWNRVAQLLAADAAAGEQFGYSVAVDDGIALIGTRGKHGSGAVYVFRDTGSGNWRQLTKLTPYKKASNIVRDANDEFGWPIAITGNLAVVGASADSSEGHDYAGAAYLFQEDAKAGWKQVAKLTAPVIKAREIFGRAVAKSGKTVLVGAPGHDDGRGAVYLFQEDDTGAWQPLTQLSPRDATPRIGFGNAVAMNEGLIAVGAPLQNQHAGAVYLFHDDGTGAWQQFGRLTLEKGATRSWFGASLALSGKALLVGAHAGGGNTPKSGAVYLFRLRK